MKKIIYSMAFAVLGMFAVPAFAQAASASASWTAPTTYTDGSALSGSQITSYTVYYGTTAGGPYPNSLVVPSVSGTTPTTATISNLGVGTWYFVVTVTTTNGMTSVYSNQASKIILPSAAPNAPTVLTIK